MTLQFQACMLAGALALLVIIFIFLKKGLMTVKYSLLWLGLSIVRSLVQLMGGTFRLSIDADLFRADVTLPLVQQD